MDGTVGGRDMEVPSVYGIECGNEIRSIRQVVIGLQTLVIL